MLTALACFSAAQEALHYYVRAAALTQVGVVFGTGPGGGFGYVTGTCCSQRSCSLACGHVIACCGKVIAIGYSYVVADFTADPLDSDLDTVADIIDLDVDNDGVRVHAFCRPMLN